MDDAHKWLLFGKQTADNPVSKPKTHTIMFQEYLSDANSSELAELYNGGVQGTLNTSIGEFTFEIDQWRAAELVCLQAHTFAVSTALIAPGIKCCRSCALYPDGYLTTYTWPG